MIFSTEEGWQGPEADQEGTSQSQLALTGSDRYPPAFPTRLTGLQYIINASQPANDKIFDVSAFEKFLQDRIKVEGRTNNLGDNVVISQKGDGKIEIIAHNELSGRYLKYLYGTPFFFVARLRRT